MNVIQLHIQEYEYKDLQKNYEFVYLYTVIVIPKLSIINVLMYNF